MILFLCVGMGRDYFVPTNEYLSGILTSLALFGLPFSEQGNKSGKLLTFGCFIIFISINFHPISILSLLFIIVYQVIDEKKEFRKYWIYLGVFVALTWIFRIILFPFDIYESEKTGATSSLMQNLFHPEKLSGLKSMIQYLGRISPEIIALFFISLLLLVRDYLKLLFFITSVYVFLILFSIVKGTGEVAIWHGEYLTLLGAIIIIPFSHSIIKFPKKKNLIPAALSISAFFCFYHIHENYSYFNNRINYVERLIHNGKAFPERRYIIGTKNIPRNYVANTWAITFQTLLLSSFTHADSAMTYISAHDVNSYDSLIKDPNYFLGPEWEIGMFNASANKIRKNYFNLPGKGYKKLATSLNSILDSAFTNSSIHLYATDTILYSTNDTFTVASLKIVNTSGIMIPALPRNESAVHLSYHLYDNSGKLILWDNCRTSLETDVYEEINQGLTVSTAGLSKGKYLVHADLVIENKRWLEINTSIHLLVK